MPTNALHCPRQAWHTSSLQVEQRAQLLNNSHPSLLLHAGIMVITPYNPTLEVFEHQQKVTLSVEQAAEYLQGPEPVEPILHAVDSLNKWLRIKMRAKSLQNLQKKKRQRDK